MAQWPVQACFIVSSCVFDVYFLAVVAVLVVSISAVDCVLRHVSKMTCYVSNGTLNSLVAGCQLPVVFGLSPYASVVSK